MIALLASLTYGIIEAPDRGWSSTLIVGCLRRSPVVSLVALLIWEHRVREPLIDLRFFRSVPFSSAAVIAVAAFAALGGFLFLNTLYLQDVRGLSPLQAGIDTLPMAAMTMLLPPISGRMVGRRGARIPLVIAGTTLVRLLPHAGRAERHDPVHVVVHRLRDLRHRLRFRERADHQRRRLGHAPGPGRRGLGHRLARRARSARPWAWRWSARWCPPPCRRGTTSTSPWPAGPAGGSWPDAGRWCWSSAWSRPLRGPGPPLGARPSRSIPSSSKEARRDDGEDPTRTCGPRGVAGDGRSGAGQRAPAGGQRPGRSELRKDQGVATDRRPAHADEGAGRAARHGSAQLDHGGRRPRARRAWWSARPIPPTGGSSLWWPRLRGGACPTGRGDTRAATGRACPSCRPTISRPWRGSCPAYEGSKNPERASPTKEPATKAFGTVRRPPTAGRR